MSISVFTSDAMTFEPYPDPEARAGSGRALICRLVGRHNSQGMAGGVAIYARMTVSWNLPFDELITVIEGAMTVTSGDASHALGPGDLAWFPAQTPLTYQVPDRVKLSYAIWPMP